MFTPNPDEIVIYGATADGKPFRPSDWAERLCGLLSSFGKEHASATTNGCVRCSSAKCAA